jgi:hypothetical protein
MKKIKIFSVLMILSMVFLINGCAKKEKNIINGGNCDALLTAYSNALTAFSTNQTKENCTNVYNTLKDYVNGCATLSAADKKNFNDQLATDFCSGL